MAGENITFLEDEFEDVKLEPDDTNVLSPTNGDPSPSKKHNGQDGSGAPVPPGVGAFLTGGRDSVDAEDDDEYEVESTPRNEDETTTPNNKEEKKKKGISGLWSKTKKGVSDAANKTNKAVKKQMNKKNEKHDRQESKVPI